MFNAYKRMTHQIVNMVNTVQAGDEDYIDKRLGKVLITRHQRKAICEAGELAAARGLVPLFGEVSMRLSHSRMAITVRRADIGALAEADIIPVSLDTEKEIEMLPPLAQWHRAVYANSEAGGALFCQPAYTMVASGARLQLDDTWIEGITTRLGGVAIAEPGLTYDAVLPLLGHHVLMVPGRGALIWGASMADAIQRAGVLEYAARIAVIAHQGDLTPAGR